MPTLQTLCDPLKRGEDVTLLVTLLCVRQQFPVTTNGAVLVYVNTLALSSLSVNTSVHLLLSVYYFGCGLALCDHNWCALPIFYSLVYFVLFLYFVWWNWTFCSFHSSNFQKSNTVLVSSSGFNPFSLHSYNYYYYININIILLLLFQYFGWCSTWLVLVPWFSHFGLVILPRISGLWFPIRTCSFSTPQVWYCITGVLYGTVRILYTNSLSFMLVD